jgi:hypothetical protein
VDEDWRDRVLGKWRHARSTSFAHKKYGICPIDREWCREDLYARRGFSTCTTWPGVVNDEAAGRASSHRLILQAAHRAMQSSVKGRRKNICAKLDFVQNGAWKTDPEDDRLCVRF